MSKKVTKKSLCIFKRYTLHVGCTFGKLFCIYKRKYGYVKKWRGSLMTEKDRQRMESLEAKIHALSKEMNELKQKSYPNFEQLETDKSLVQTYN